MLLKTEYDVSQSTFKHIESEWFRYPETVKEIQRIRQNIISSTSTDENIGGGKSNLPSSPTEKLAIRLSSHKQLEYLEDLVHAIETVYNLAPDDYRKIARLRYWDKKKLDWNQVAEDVGYSRVHAIRIRKQLIVATAEILGWR